MALNWTFQLPAALWLMLLPLAWMILVLLARRRFQPKQQAAFSGSRTLFQEESKRARRVQRVLFGVALLSFLLLVTAIARPTTIHASGDRKSEAIDIVITLDVSESMIADDFPPDRLHVAKSVIRDFIKKRPNDRVGFVVFGGESFTKSPLTEDLDFVLNQVQSVQLRELKQGTAIGMGLASALTRLRNSTAKTKLIVLLTDGDSNVGDVNPVTAAHLARQEKIRIYSIGIGKQNRVLVPIYNMDSFGNRRGLVAQVPSYLNPELLAEISSMTGGRSYMARNPGMLSEILTEIDKLEKSKVILKPKIRLEEWYRVFAIAGLVGLALILLLQDTRYRRGNWNVPVAA